MAKGKKKQHKKYIDWDVITAEACQKFGVGKVRLARDMNEVYTEAINRPDIKQFHDVNG